MLVEELRRRQRDAGWSDEEMARRIGRTRPTWSEVKRGINRPSPEFLGGVLVAFPDLAGMTLAHLVERHSKTKESAR